MKGIMKRFFKEEEGQGMVEYGLIIALIAVAVIAALGLLGDQISALFDAVRGRIVYTP